MMKTTLIAFLLCIHTVRFMAGEPWIPETNGIPDLPGPEHFILVKSDENIRILYRWVPVDANRSARQLKAEFTVDCPVESILEVIHDDQNFQHWMKNTDAYYRIRSVDTLNWYSYVQFSVPWPLSNQDCILHYQLTGSFTSGVVRIRITGEPDFLRDFEGVNRIRHLEIDWVLKRIGQNSTRIEYYVFSKQVSRFPKALTDPIIQNNLLKTMNAFRETVKERRSL